MEIITSKISNIHHVYSGQIDDKIKNDDNSISSNKRGEFAWQRDNL